MKKHIAILALFALTLAAFGGIYLNSITGTNDAGALAFIGANATNRIGVAQTFYVTNNNFIWGIQPDGSTFTSNLVTHAWSIQDSNEQFNLTGPYGNTLISGSNYFAVNFTNGVTWTATNIGGVIYYISNTIAGSSLLFSNGILSIGGNPVDASVAANLQAQVATNLVNASNGILTKAASLVAATNTPYFYTVNPFTLNSLYTNLSGSRVKGFANWNLRVGGAVTATQILFTNLTQGVSQNILLNTGASTTNSGMIYFDMATNDVVLITNIAGVGSIISSYIMR